MKAPFDISPAPCEHLDIHFTIGHPGTSTLQFRYKPSRCLLTALLGLLCALLPVLAQAQSFELLFSDNVGRSPEAGLVKGSDGDFYGTTYEGGASNRGTVFKMTSAGVLTTLHSFNSTNGSHPYAGLVQGSDGDFYGTTQSGGASGYGTVFKITPAGVFTTLHSFDGANGRHSRAV
jgi:uncharacterized repeat protein (TIGR03803 family)